MGLLDGMFGSSMDDPKTQGMLALGLGLLGGRGNFGQVLSQAGMQGMGAYQQGQDRQAQAKARAMQAQMAQFQLEEQLRKQAQEKKDRALIEQFSMPKYKAGASIMKPGSMDGGPLPFNPLAMLQEGASPQAVQTVGAFQPQAKAPIKVGKDDALLDPTTFKPVFQGAGSKPSPIQEYEYAKQQGYQGTYEQWATSQKRAGASSISVNTGQKGLDNELKIRGDFKTEPVYKAFQETAAAHQQIKAAIRQASPAGDLAAATKIMKILDPGSVVRESELGMAMAASGLLDRAANYAEMLIKGTKLTPQQRKDFGALADALFAEAEKAYSAKEQEYQGIARAYGLDPKRSTGSRPNFGGMTTVDDLVDFYTRGGDSGK